METGAATRFVRLGVPDVYAPIGHASELYAHFGYDADGIERAVRRLVAAAR